MCQMEVGLNRIFHDSHERLNGKAIRNFAAAAACSLYTIICILGSGVDYSFRGLQRNS